MAVPLAERRFLSDPSETEMPKTADVVIIGGGMAGPAASWALNRLDSSLRIVLLEEQDQLASGASMASIENFRLCWPTPCLIKMMQYSVDVFLYADDYFGEGASEKLNVRQRGYLYCGFNQKQQEELQADVKYLHSIGLEHIEFLDADEVAYRYPWLGRNVVAAKVDPMAGWLDSNSLAQLYARSGRSAKFLLGMKDARILVEGNKVVGVTTHKGRISTPNVIIAAGANSREVGKSAGIDIPIVVRPRNSFTTAFRHEDYPADSPFIIGMSPYPYTRPTGNNGAIFGWEYHWSNKKTEEGTKGKRDHLVRPIWPIPKETWFPPVTLSLLARQFGHKDGTGFSDPRYLSGRVGHQAGYYVYRAPETTYATTPEGQKIHYDSERAIIDAWPGIDGLFLSVAHVGHGVMSSPAAGEIVAAHILGREQPDPLFYNFQLNVSYVENDKGGICK